MKVSLWLRNSILSSCLLLTLLAPLVAPAAPLWRIGLEDNSGAEFTGSPDAFNPSLYTVPADWSTRATWPEWKSGTGETPLNTTINYNLSQVPAGGAEFVLKTMQASAMVPQVAVFSNGKLMGILQIIGAWIPNWKTDPQKFGETYKVYIPSAFLKTGTNSLTLEKLPATYAQATQNYSYQSISWDYMRLDALASVPMEPLHSRRIGLGSVYGSFSTDEYTAELEPRIWEWLGIAYSGNPERASFWSNLPGYFGSKKEEWLKKTMEYQMAPILDFMTDQNTGKDCASWFDSDGELVASKKKALDQAISDWGPYVQYYEISNEPCMGFDNGAFSVDKAIAAYLCKIKPAHLKITAPGYAYGGGAGTPKNWDCLVANRIELERYCDATGGHSYGNSFYQVDHGDFLATIDTYASGTSRRIVNGFPKEMVITECGTHHTSHKDFDNLGVTPENLWASMYDKNLRAHIGFATEILNFATFADQDAPYTLLDGSRKDPTTWTAHLFPNAKESEPKLRIFRRLACAYATHGKPLVYTYLNSAEVENQLVYFRGVDTSFLPPMPGNGHRSNKILLNFVNFDTVNSHRMNVRVTFPSKGTYTGFKFTGANRYTDAKSEAIIQSAPNADFDIQLSPGEAVQFLLEKGGELDSASKGGH